HSRPLCVRFPVLRQLIRGIVGGTMDTSSAVRAYGFPAQIMEAEIERFGVRESFTWGPQTLWLLCGFLWLFYYLVRDIPEVNRATLLFCAGASLLALLG